MAIDDPQVKAFCDQYLRKLADLGMQLYSWANLTNQIWVAQDIIGQIGAEYGEEVIDGAQTDGRPVITVGDVYALVNAGAAFVAGLDASGGAERNKWLKPAVNPGG